MILWSSGKRLSLNVITNVYIVSAGLSNVYARPDGFASVVAGLAPGTKELVNVTYSADCCSSQVDIIGVDTQGNVGKCVIDMGALGGMSLEWTGVWRVCDGPSFMLLLSILLVLITL